MESVNQFSRDNARTPFQWDASDNAGFSAGTPWLRVNPNYREINLDAQRGDPDSVWNFYRALIALRKNPDYREAVVYGETTPYLSELVNVMAYFRRSDAQTLLVVGNCQDTEQKIPLPGTVKQVLLNNLRECVVEHDTLSASPWQFVILEMDT